MNLIRLLGAFGVLFALALYFYLNTRVLSGGSGYLLLLVALACTGAVIFGNGDLLSLPLLRLPAVLLIFFVTYFVVKYYVESGDWEATKQLSFGTSGGVVFAFALGFMVSMALLALHDLACRFRGLSRLLMLALTGYAVLVLLLTFSTMQHHIADVRSDVFMIEEQEGKYQRAGDFMIMQMGIVVAVGAMLMSRAEPMRLVAFLPLTAVVVTTAALMGITAQVIASNKGLVVNSGLALLYLFMLFVTAGRNRGVTLSQLLVGRQLPRMILALSVALVLMIGAGALFVNFFDIDLEKLRITNFGSGEVRSLEARNDFFGSFFMEHFRYAPLFGHTQVDKIYSGDSGYFVHSLLAILPHLGIFGFVVFVWLIASMCRGVVASTRSGEKSLFGSTQYGTFRILFLWMMILMCSFAAFFTWVPLWFALGLCGNWFRSTVSARVPTRLRKRQRRRRKPLGSPVRI